MRNPHPDIQIQQQRTITKQGQSNKRLPTIFSSSHLSTFLADQHPRSALSSTGCRPRDWVRGLRFKGLQIRCLMKSAM